MRKYTGVLTRIADTIPGENALNQGLVYTIDVEDEDFKFVIREVKSYITKLSPRTGERLFFYFRRDVSPKFGDCYLLYAYGKDAIVGLLFEEGRRILIHRGNGATNSANCWIIGRPTMAFSSRETPLERKLTHSVETLKSFLDRGDEEILFELLFKEVR